MRHPGHPSSAALATVPVAIDCRIGRPPAPERLSPAERDLWEKLTFSRRPRWFDGCEAVLESYVVTAIACQRLEAALRRVRPGASDRFQKLLRMHRQSAMLAASLATKLRLTPSTKLDKRTPQDGELPLGGTGYPNLPRPLPDDVVGPDGERSFAKLRERQMCEGQWRAFRDDEPPPSEPSELEPISSESPPPSNVDDNGSS